MTVQQFQRMGRRQDGRRTELVGGEVVVLPPGGLRRSRIIARVAASVGGYVGACGLGEVGLGVGVRPFPAQGTVRSPSVYFIAADQPEFLEDDEGFVTGAPALAIEVTSPDDRDSYLARKVGEYLEAGSRRVWVVRPDLKAVTVHYPDGTSRLFREGDTLTSHEAGFSLPGFALPLDDLFR